MKLTVYIDVDDASAMFHSPEAMRDYVATDLMIGLGRYNPHVSVAHHNQNDTLGAYILERRDALDMSRNVLSEKAGISLGYLRLIETDKRVPSRTVRDRIKEVLA